MNQMAGCRDHRPIVRSSPGPLSIQSTITFILGLLIRTYQILVSPLLGPGCRFQPTCSEYAREALRRHGVLQGSRLAAKRILRCHPWGPSGLDPVP